MSCEEDAKEVVHFTLVPVRAVVKVGDGGHWSCFVRVCLDSDTGVVSHGEKVVNDFEALRAGRVIDGGDVGDHGVFGCRVELEE